MVRKIITYPEIPSIGYNVDVRKFDEKIFALIDDLKETIEANNINALASFQIGDPTSLIVIKQDNGEFLELINPRILKREGEVITSEKTTYFPGLSAKVKRYEKIQLMYQDREGKDRFLNADGDLAITLQRKYDYVFGANFRIRLDKDEKKLFDSKLEFGTDALDNNDCPTVFKRDIILKVYKYLMILGFIGIIASFFIGEGSLAALISAEKYTMAAMLTLLIIYFFYAQYEGREYKQCTSCQIGNIIGTTLISSVKLLVLFLANYFILFTT